MAEENEYNAKLCDERHKFIAEELKSIGMKINGFYVLAITTLAAIVASYFKV